MRVSQSEEEGEGAGLQEGNQGVRLEIRSLIEKTNDNPLTLEKYVVHVMYDW